jgi:hypothetical protein
MSAVDLDRVDERRSNSTLSRPRAVVPRPHVAESVLVVANQTIASDALFELARRRASTIRTVFTLLVPADVSDGSAASRVTAAADRMRRADMKVDRVVFRRGDPFTPILGVYERSLYDEIIISTLEQGQSQWLRLDLPRRVQRATGAVVTRLSAGGKSQTFC